LPVRDHWKARLQERFGLCRETIVIVALTLSVWGVTLYVANVASNYASMLYPQPWIDNNVGSTARDIGFTFIPAFTGLAWLTPLVDIAIAGATLCFIVFYYAKPFLLLCQTLLMLAIANIVRSLLVMSTTSLDPRHNCRQVPLASILLFESDQCGSTVASAHAVLFGVCGLVWSATAHVHHSSNSQTQRTSHATTTTTTAPPISCLRRYIKPLTRDLLVLIVTTMASLFLISTRSAFTGDLTTGMILAVGVFCLVHVLWDIVIVRKQRWRCLHHPRLLVRERQLQRMTSETLPEDATDDAPDPSEVVLVAEEAMIDDLEDGPSPIFLSADENEVFVAEPCDLGERIPGSLDV
jgi:hypothetical protein